MNKKIYIGESNLIKLKRFMTGEQTSHKPFIAEDEPPYEDDEYEIGGEGGNNDFFHINESNRADLNIIDSISYSVNEKYYFDEEEYKHWYDNYDSEEEYLKSCERYDGEVYDTDGHHIDFFGGDRDEIEYYFSDNLYIAEKIFNKEGRYSQGEYWLTDIQDEFVNEMDVNINDVDSVNKAAKRLSKPNGASQFILTDGSIIAFHDHVQIQSVCDGMTISKFLELGNIRYGGGNVATIELIKQPTHEQQSTLKNLLAYADEVIVDFAAPNKNDNIYPEVVHSVTYRNPDNRRVVNDIMNYFWEGIKPFGENRKKSSNVMNENTFEKWFGNSILKDENGNPLKMYHGTDAEFKSFSKDFIGSTGSFEGYGFNFTPFYGRAASYNSKNVIEAYLRVEAPMTTNSYNISLKDLINIISELDKEKPYTDTIVAAYEPARYNEKWDEQYYRRALPIAAKTVYQYNKESEYGDAGLYAEICLNGNADKIKTIDVFEKLGYDSAIFYNNDGKINTVVVFEPNQIKRTTNTTFNNDSEIMDENIETEVEASEVKLDSFKKNDALADRIWDGMDLNPRVRLKLLDIADDFWEFANINWVKRKGIYLTGSICNYNWSRYSDIDLHIVVDFSEVDERNDFVQEYFDSKKNEWNKEHDNLKLYGFPVEIYVEDVNADTVSGGKYDLEENKWIKEPNSDDIKEIGLDKYEIKNKSAKIMTLIDDMYDELNSTDDDAKLRKIGDKAHKLLNKIKVMRKFGLSRGGESDYLNISYKVLRRSGYLDKLWDLNSELYDKLNSLGLEESTIMHIAEKYIKYHLKELNEEIVADGNADHNPFKERWRHEREVLKNYILTYGELMTSKENGKQYRCLFDDMLSQRLGYNYCLCIQWDPLTMESGNIIYVRAYDKFTKKIFQPQFDTRGKDNIAGTGDDNFA